MEYPRTTTLFEPLAVVLHSMQFVALRPMETAAVFGAGLGGGAHATPPGDGEGSRAGVRGAV